MAHNRFFFLPALETLNVTTPFLSSSTRLSPRGGYTSAKVPRGQNAGPSDQLALQLINQLPTPSLGFGVSDHPLFVRSEKGRLHLPALQFLGTILGVFVNESTA